MDRAVLDAYGWPDIPTDCEFISELDDDADEEPERGGSRKKKTRYRYRWPDDVRDEVLARLLELNRQRAEDERMFALEEERRPGKTPKGGRNRGRAKPGGGHGSPGLF